MSQPLPRLLLVNPWVHDFAAYDFWAKPYGLLLLGAILRDHGFPVSYIDCLDRFHPKNPAPNPFLRGGRGPLLKTEIDPPEGIGKTQRRYSRYGIKPEWFTEDLRQMPQPDLIFITSVMTYWAPGVKETIDYLKAAFPSVPVILGGIYATLCYDHAQQYSGADIVVQGNGESQLFPLIEELTDTCVTLKYDPEDMDSVPFPAFDLQNKISYIPLMTSRGCPFRCTYCASDYLEPVFRQKSPARVVDEIRFWHRNYRIINYALYDDAFLVNKSDYAHTILKGIIDYNQPLQFHTPNALHAREIDAQTADLMYKAGFKTIRLGVETADFKKREDLDTKITGNEFISAVQNLKQAGFTKDQVGAYLLAGLPGQSYDDIKDSVSRIIAEGITPVLAHYTPIPHTPMWDTAVAQAKLPIESNPVFTNNALGPCTSDQSEDAIFEIKKIISQK